ncbi:MAG: transporter substrate-binding domain-containing protein [Alphaproteobacteria bacterium]|nr:transporter substrate-binding domain-containing protein [Alphaproteobacteria bacterium]
MPNVKRCVITRRRLLSGLAHGPIALALAARPLAAQDARSHLAAASVIEDIKKRGTLTVGVATFVPWAMRNKSGDLIGFEVDVARRLSEDMGVKLDLVPTAFDGMVPALIARKFDVVITGIVISEARQLLVNFTQPYAWSIQGFIANRKLTAGMTSFTDLNRPEVNVVARRGSSVTGAFMQRVVPAAQKRLYDDDTSAIQEVLNGRAHGFFSAEPKPTLWALENPDILWTPIPRDRLPSVPTGFMVRKGDPDGLAYFNSWILLRQMDGWLDERQTYWFTTRDWYDQLDRKPF